MRLRIAWEENKKIRSEEFAGLGNVRDRPSSIYMVSEKRSCGGWAT